MAFRCWFHGRTRAAAALAVGLAGLLSGCQGPPAAERNDDQIVVAGRRYHTGTRVVTWEDPAGYNAYAAERPPGPRKGLPADADLAALRRTVDQFVLHYDGCGLSKICFATLRGRSLSVHFLLDLDGTVYQTLDLRDRALHATTSNDRSIGIEIANLGAYAPGNTNLLDQWYRRDAHHRAYLQVPKAAGDPRLLTPNFTARPDRPELIRGTLQGRPLVQYDFTPEQYAALSRLTAELCRIFPGIKCDFPRDRQGRLVTRKLPDEALAKYHGLLGHWHIQENKEDPGPAFQWSRLLHDARLLLRQGGS